MSKQNNQKKALKKAFNSLLKAFEKEPDKRVRKQIASSLHIEFQKLKSEMKSRLHQAPEQPTVEVNYENASSIFTPSTAVLDEMREAVFAS